LDPEVGILLADFASFELARKVATSEARWFLMDDAVLLLPELGPLIDEGHDVTVCATDAAALLVQPMAGVRFGSQYDHAAMMASATRILALTGVKLDDHTPKRTERTVVVRITREAKVAQALRSAVGYVGGDLRVAVLFEEPVRNLQDQPPQKVARALATLRALDHPVVTVAPGTYPERLRWDLEVTW
jgi:hypothetical protein